MTDEVEPSEGFVIAASGADYVPFAFNAAKSLRDVHPDTPIDLFTDVQVDDPGPFDRIVPLQRSWYRPKLEALRCSRFKRTIYLDTDIFVLADITDVFEVLRKFDIVGVHNEKRSTTRGTNIWNEDIPNSFPQINGGLLGIAKSDATQKFIENVEAALTDGGPVQDQVPIRELLWTGELRPWVLPIEYNMMNLRLTDHMRPAKHAAPRILHLQRLHRHLRKDTKETNDLCQIIGRRRIAKLEKLLAEDSTLKGRPVADLSVYRHGIAHRLVDIWLRLSK